MAASQDECNAQFPRQQVCIDRTYSRSIAWAAYTTSLPLPPTNTAPAVDWVRQRVLAERMPANANGYVSMIAPYLLEVPQITGRIRDHLNAWNDETTEGELVADIDTGFAVIMPKFAAAVISDQEVIAWCNRNGYPVPPELETPPGQMR